MVVLRGLVSGKAQWQAAPLPTRNARRFEPKVGWWFTVERVLGRRAIHLVPDPTDGLRRGPIMKRSAPVLSVHAPAKRWQAPPSQRRQ